MARSLTVVLSLLVVVLSRVSFAGSASQSGPISASSGVADRDLKYQDFQISDDGFISGYIVNASSKARKGVLIDMWTTNKAETRILWRKGLSIGDLGPGEKRLVKEPYQVDLEEPARTEIKFRVASGANFRNK